MEKAEAKNICTVVIPAYNEEKTVRKVVSVVLKTENVTEVIVVDDGSTDKTRQNIADLPIKIINHPKNLGYSRAMKDGITQARGPVVAVVDADWRNITTAAVSKIIQPVIEGRADLVKASFNMARGRVTEFAVKPMMRILFPDFVMNQPISGQFASHKSFLEKVEVETSWGIAIGILIEAINAGLRVMEVEIGELVHKARTTEEKALMAQEVLETMIRKAGLIQHKYKLIIFTLDRVILQQTAMNKVYVKLGISKEMSKLQEGFVREKIDFKEFITKSAMLFKGKSVKEVEDAALALPTQKYSEEVIKALKRRKFNVALVSRNFSPIVKPVAAKIGIDKISCIGLEVKNGILTGKVSAASAQKWLANKNRDETYKKVFNSVIKKEKIKATETVMVFNSLSWEAILTRVGMSIAYRPESREVREIADKTISILPELLAVIE